MVKPKKIINFAPQLQILYNYDSTDSINRGRFNA